MPIEKQEAKLSIEDLRRGVPVPLESDDTAPSIEGHCVLNGRALRNAVFLLLVRHDTEDQVDADEHTTRLGL